MAQATETNTTSRRQFLRTATAGAAVVQPLGVSLACATPIASAPGDDPDAEILDLETEIHRQYAAAQVISHEGTAPLRDEFTRLLNKVANGLPSAREELKIFGEQSGWNRAIADADVFFNRADDLIHVMWSKTAKTNAGRAAKCRIFLLHVVDDSEWLGPDSDLDWDISLGRRLMFELAGMSAADIALLSVRRHLTAAA